MAGHVSSYWSGLKGIGEKAYRSASSSVYHSHENLGSFFVAELIDTEDLDCIIVAIFTDAEVFIPDRRRLMLLLTTQGP